MRPRKWVIVLGLCAFAFFAALNQVSKYLENHRNLEKLLIQGISPFIKGSFDVQKVRLGIFTAHLKNVVLLLPGHSASIKIRDIKVGLSIYRLVKFRGDLSRSINKIILNGPLIDISFSPSSSDSDSPSGPEMLSFPDGINPEDVAVVVPDELPVKHLIVKKGVIRLYQEGGDTVVLGEQLSGTMLAGNVSETTVNLNGKLGSVKNNLALQGSISWRGEKNRLSVRLNGAAINKPVFFSDFCITQGALSGTVEFVFPSRISLSVLETNGWIRVENGTCRFTENNHLLHSVQMKMSMAGQKWMVDTLSCQYKGMKLDLSGHWDLSRGPLSYFEYSCTGINGDSLSAILMPEMKGKLTGEGWCEGKLSGTKFASGLKVKVSGGGLSAWGYPIVGVNADMRLDSLGVRVDSAIIISPGTVVFAEGKIEPGREYAAYDTKIRVVVDSIPSLPGFSGRLRASGILCGAREINRMQFNVSGDGITYNNVAIGDLECNVKHKNNQILISAPDSGNDRGLDFSGVINDPFGKSPRAKISAKLGYDQINRLLERKHAMYSPDFARVDINAEGWVDTFRVNLEAVVRDSSLDGMIAGSMGKIGESPLMWNLSGKKLTFNSVPVPFYCRGKLYEDSVVVDSLSALNGIRGSGKVSLGSDPLTCEARVGYDIQISHLLSFMPGLSLKVDSGRLKGSSKISGSVIDPEIRSELHVRELSSGALSGLQTDAIASLSSGRLTILPFVIRKDKHVVAAFDTIRHYNDSVSFTGEFDDISLKALFGAFIPRDLDLESNISGRVRTSGRGFPLLVNFSTPSLRVNDFSFDSLTFTGSIVQSGLKVERISASEGNRLQLSAAGYVPWSVLGKGASESDTLRATVDLQGDLLASIEKNVDSPIGGQGRGSASIEFYGVPGNWVFTSGKVSIPEGKLTLNPFVLDEIKDFSFSMNVDSLSRVHTMIMGNIRRRPVKIFSSHDIPPGYESFQIGPLDFGVMQMETPKNGIHVHLPGFMAPGEIGDIEFAGKSPLRKFTISGPLDRLRITGTWVLRDLEFTFPFLNTNEMPWEFDPFPYVTWDMDLRPGNRKVMYFWDLAGKKRRIMRFVEGYLDPVSVVKVRGRDLDKTFRLYGLIRSFKGAAYYGKVFDRNFDVGVEFVPQKLKDGRSYDNMPILWGSAEAFSDTSRFDRIKLTCLVNDPVSGAVSERGRLVEGKQLNVSFHLSSDFEELPGESERDFYREAGLNFTTLGKAGEMVSSFGEQYFHRYLLQKWERRLAKSVGLDVINIESSIASNYFNKLYNRQFDGRLGQDDYLALANVGITVGRYFFRDFLFLKARGELIPIDTVLKPEYSIGLEFQPSRYLTMDFNYGIRKGEAEVEHNPRLNMQLMLPITRLRKLMNF